MQSRSPKIEKDVPPYSQLARIYDAVMAHVNYNRWADFINSVVQKRHPLARTLLDASCGTGSFLQYMNNYGYQLSGFDYSLAMVQQACLKIRLGKVNANVWQGDIRTFGLTQPVDVIVCLYDSINYIMMRDQIIETLNNVHDALNRNGLFIFDVCTEWNSIKYFDNFIDRDRGPGFKYVRESSFDRDRRIHRNVFHIDFDGEETIYVEQHEQYIYYLEEVETMVASDQFELIEILDGFSFRPPSKRSLRVHFVLQKVD